MNGVETKPASRSWGKKIWWGLKVAVVVIILIFFLGLFSLLELPFRLVFGWVFYLVEVVPQTRINPELLLSSSAALLLSITGMQWLMRKFCDRNRWPWRFTLAWCGILVVMFGTSIAAVGIVHQTGWLFRLPKWIEMRGFSMQAQAMNNAKQVLLAAKQHAKDHDGRLPDTCAEMMPEIVSEARIFWATVDRGMPLEPLVYAGAGMSDTDAGNLLVIWTPRPSADGRRVVMRLDGSGSFVREEEFQSMLVSRQAFLNRHEAAVKTPR